MGKSGFRCYWCLFLKILYNFEWIRKAKSQRLYSLLIFGTFAIMKLSDVYQEGIRFMKYKSRFSVTWSYLNWILVFPGEPLRNWISCLSRECKISSGLGKTMAAFSLARRLQEGRPSSQRLRFPLPGVCSRVPSPRSGSARGSKKGKRLSAQALFSRRFFRIHANHSQLIAWFSQLKGRAKN